MDNRGIFKEIKPLVQEAVDKAWKEVSAMDEETMRKELDEYLRKIIQPQLKADVVIDENGKCDVTITYPYWRFSETD